MVKPRVEKVKKASDKCEIRVEKERCESAAPYHLIMESNEMILKLKKKIR